MTKDEALKANNFEHLTAKNKNGTPLRARRNGKTKTWKTRPDEFSVPAKYGMYGYFYITHENANEWKVS